MRRSLWSAALLLGPLLGGCRSLGPVELLGPEPQLSPWVGALPIQRQAERPVRLLLLGHTYGDFAKRTADSPGPAATLVQGVDRLAERDPDVVVLLGDSVFGFRPECLDPTLAALERLDAPVLAAVGNHELGGRPDAYRARFGGTWGALRIGPCLLLVLDAETTPWNLGLEQRIALLAATEQALADGVRNVVVVVHKLVWAVGSDRYRPLLERANALDGFAGESDFGSFLDALRTRIAQRASLICASGDVGAPHSVPLFYDRHPQQGVDYLAVGLGETPRDCALLLSLSPGEHRIEIVPLGSESPTSLDEVGLESLGATP